MQKTRLDYTNYHPILDNLDKRIIEISIHVLVQL